MASERRNSLSPPAAASPWTLTGVVSRRRLYGVIVSVLMTLKPCRQLTIIEDERPSSLFGGGTLLHSGSSSSSSKPVVPESLLRFVLINNLSTTMPMEHFDQFLYEDNRLLVGTRNGVYDINLKSMQLNQKIEWLSTDLDVERCRLKQKSKDDCENYVRVITRQKTDEYLICGTNAFNPRCRVYVHSRQDGQYMIASEQSGIARCPFGRTHNSTTHYTDGRLYSATTADWSSRDSLIYSQPLRTEQHNSQWLNDAQFISSFDYTDKVYFFLREIATEQINCGKVVLSRVARVCKRDVGGGRVLRHTWTSFFKARLNCSIPGTFPFHFDEIQATTELGKGNVHPSTSKKAPKTLMVYTVMTTPRNSIRGSAVCAFTLSDISHSFEGAFKEQKTAHSNWLPVSDKDIPQPHPALECSNDSLSMSDHSLNFIKSHPLMDQSVPAAAHQPIVVQAGFRSGFTTIAVDWQVRTADRRRFDVLYIGTDDGRVLKVINKAKDRHQTESVIVESLQVFQAPIIHIHIHEAGGKWENGLTTDESKTLLVATRQDIVSLPLFRCHTRITCSDCVAMRDPYCSWVQGQGCVHSRKGYQNVDTGVHPICRTQPAAPSQHNEVLAPIQSEAMLTSSNDVISWKEPLAVVRSTSIDDVSDLNVSSQISAGPCYTESWKGPHRGSFYSAETIALASTVCILVSLTAGCTLGFGVATYRRSAVRDLANEHQQQRRSHWTDADDLAGTEHVPVANGTALARLQTVLNRYGVGVTGLVPPGPQKPMTASRLSVDKACQTYGSTVSAQGCRSSSLYRKINISPTNTIMTDYASRGTLKYR